MVPLLSTHLSLAEVAGELVLSRNTIKSQVAAIYRKLDATSRTEAVRRATDLGLLDQHGGRRAEQAVAVVTHDRRWRTSSRRRPAAN